MELVEVAPCSDTAQEIHGHLRIDKVLHNEHGNRPKPGPQLFQIKAHKAAVQVHIGFMVEHVERARHIDFKGCCQPYRLALGLGTEQVIQGLEGRHFACFRVLQVFPVHLAHTAVNDGTLHRLQAVLAADD